ncbi:uncharacterized protein LOC132152318 [Carassius carassius]|uniref:uncharacterized protein LOC132152318 n=1 Tax=Carassius carassius TaxID=217509 RepID=UPI002868BBEA|nr:uncharacterized protein LOC132152318 [Carassius carassius]
MNRPDTKINCKYGTTLQHITDPKRLLFKVTGAIQLIQMENAKKSFDVFSTSLSKCISVCGSMTQQLLPCWPQHSRPFRVINSDRSIKKGIMADDLKDLQKRGLTLPQRFTRNEVNAQGFHKVMDVFHMHCISALVLDEDGTGVDTEDFFQTLKDNTVLMVLIVGQKWAPQERYLPGQKKIERVSVNNNGVDLISHVKQFLLSFLSCIEGVVTRFLEARCRNNQHTGSIPKPISSIPCSILSVNGDLTRLWEISGYLISGDLTRLWRVHGYLTRRWRVHGGRRRTSGDPRATEKQCEQRLAEMEDHEGLSDCVEGLSHTGGWSRVNSSIWALGSNGGISLAKHLRQKWHGDSETGIVSCFGLVLNEVDEHAEWGKGNLMLLLYLRALSTKREALKWTLFIMQTTGHVLVGTSCYIQHLIDEDEKTEAQLISPACIIKQLEH